MATDDPCKSNKYKEVAVDAMRAQKDEVNVTMCVCFSVYDCGNAATVYM